MTFEDDRTASPVDQRIDRLAEWLELTLGVRLTAFAVGADPDIAEARSNTFELEWPKGSDRMREYPEVDRVGWFPVAQARTKLLKGQRAFLDRLMTLPELAGLDEGT